MGTRKAAREVVGGSIVVWPGEGGFEVVALAGVDWWSGQVFFVGGEIVRWLHRGD